MVAVSSSPAVWFVRVHACLLGGLLDLWQGSADGGVCEAMACGCPCSKTYPSKEF